MTDQMGTVPRRRGRPRSSPSKSGSLSTREEILQAATALFSTQGFTETTTRQIADVVGIKQASLYYHFADKGAILRSLLQSTVAPSVQFAQWLRSADTSASVRVYALARYDLDGLLRDRWNLHVVYRLLDIAETEFEETKARQAALRACYRGFVLDALRERIGSARLARLDADLDLVFGLVEGVVSYRQWGDEDARSSYAEAVARGCLRLVHVPEDEIDTVIEQSDVVLSAYRSEHGDVF